MLCYGHSMVIWVVEFSSGGYKIQHTQRKLLNFEIGLMGRLWQYGLWSFQMGYTKLERFLHKNQHTQRKLLNFENWTNVEPQ